MVAHYFNVRLALWDLSDVIFKLGFRHAFGETVDGDTENSMCIEFAMYLHSVFMEIKKGVFIKFRLQYPIPSF